MTAPGQWPKQHRIPGLDHLRAFAILFVFVYHYCVLFPHPDWIYQVGKFGWSGVDLFFVLSGYLIASQLFSDIGRNHRISFKVFFIRRCCRILPAYFAVVAIYFLFPYVRERESPAPLWKYITFTQNLGLDIRNQGTFSHAWSLCIEEHFYLLLPVTLILLLHLRSLKKGVIILSGSLVLTILARYFTWHFGLSPIEDTDDFWLQWYKWIYYPTYTRLDGLLTGVSIAAGFQFWPGFKKIIMRYSNYLSVAGIIILIVAYFICVNQMSFYTSVYGFLVVSVGYGLLVMPSLDPKNVLNRIHSEITATLARLSYSLYLIHKIAVHITQDQLSRLSLPKDSNITFLICIITSVACAWILNLIVEQPFLIARNKILQWIS